MKDRYIVLHHTSLRLIYPVKFQRLLNHRNRRLLIWSSIVAKSCGFLSRPTTRETFLTYDDDQKNKETRRIVCKWISLAEMLISFCGGRSYWYIQTKGPFTKAIFVAITITITFSIYFSCYLTSLIFRVVLPAPKHETKPWTLRTVCVHKFNVTCTLHRSLPFHSLFVPYNSNLAYKTVYVNKTTLNADWNL